MFESLVVFYFIKTGTRGGKHFPVLWVKKRNERTHLRLCADGNRHRLLAILYTRFNVLLQLSEGDHRLLLLRPQLLEVPAEAGHVPPQQVQSGGHLLRLLQLRGGVASRGELRQLRPQLPDGRRQPLHRQVVVLLFVQSLPRSAADFIEFGPERDGKSQRWRLCSRKTPARSVRGGGAGVEKPAVFPVVPLRSRPFSAERWVSAEKKKKGIEWKLGESGEFPGPVHAPGNSALVPKSVPDCFRSKFNFSALNVAHLIKKPLKEWAKTKIHLVFPGYVTFPLFFRIFSRFPRGGFREYSFSFQFRPTPSNAPWSINSIPSRRKMFTRPPISTPNFIVRKPAIEKRLSNQTATLCVRFNDPFPPLQHG